MEGEEIFLANYTDGLTDLHLPALIDHFDKRDSVASFLSARPNLSFHIVSASKEGRVEKIQEMTHANLRINSGYFAFRKSIFKYIRAGEELVREPFQRLIQEKRLLAYEYDGFFQAMDTFKDRQQLENLLGSGLAPWELWKAPSLDSRSAATNVLGSRKGKRSPAGNGNA